jgi:death on curing protein
LLYLTPDDVIRLNERQVGPGALRDRFLLVSAVERPQASAFGEDAYPDIHTKAAALLQSLAGNHPFVDGNKRTAFLAVIVFYSLNGWLLQAEDVEIIHLVIDVAIGQLADVELIADSLKKWVRPVPDPA